MLAGPRFLPESSHDKNTPRLSKIIGWKAMDRERGQGPPWTENALDSRRDFNTIHTRKRNLCLLAGFSTNAGTGFIAV